MKNGSLFAFFHLLGLGFKLGVNCCLMLLLQFSTSPYCRKVRLALGYKGIPFQVENLTPGLHVLKLKPLTGGLRTVPVLLPQLDGEPEAIADSTQILHSIESRFPSPSLLPAGESLQAEVWTIEDWLDESIGIATRFVYYEFRAGAGKQIDPSVLSQLVIQLARRQFGINSASATLAQLRLRAALNWLQHRRWGQGDFLLGDSLTVADITAAALLSPLALIPQYRLEYPWLFERISQIHAICGETLPPGFETAPPEPIAPA